MEFYKHLRSQRSPAPILRKCSFLRRSELRLQSLADQIVASSDSFWFPALREILSGNLSPCIQETPRLLAGKSLPDEVRGSPLTRSFLESIARVLQPLLAPSDSSARSVVDKLIEWRNKSRSPWRARLGFGRFSFHFDGSELIPDSIAGAGIFTNS